MSELKPCPFCGSNDLVSTKIGNMKYISCPKCIFNLGDDIGVENWNTRPLEDALQAERDLLRQQLNVAKEALDKIADTSDNPKWMIADKARTEIAKLGEKK